MIRINKEEAEALREKMPDVYITIVNKHSNHKHYFVPSDRKIMAFIQRNRAKHNRSVYEKWGD